MESDGSSYEGAWENDRMCGKGGEPGADSEQLKLIWRKHGIIMPRGKFFQLIWPFDYFYYMRLFLLF
jgi:hypothetical protein